MKKILKHDYTKKELDEWGGDNLQVHDTLVEVFRYTNPKAKIILAAGEVEENKDGTFTYELTIEYTKSE